MSVIALGSLKKVNGMGYTPPHVNAARALIAMHASVFNKLPAVHTWFVLLFCVPCLAGFRVCGRVFEGN